MPLRPKLDRDAADRPAALATRSRRGSPATELLAGAAAMAIAFGMGLACGGPPSPPDRPACTETPTRARQPAAPAHRSAFAALLVPADASARRRAS